MVVSFINNVNKEGPNAIGVLNSAVSKASIPFFNPYEGSLM